MGAKKGNRNRLKHKTSKERKQLCRELISHIEAGYSLQSFPHCSKNTLKYYVQEFPEDFPREDLERAYRISYKKDESIGLAASMGQYVTNFDPARFNVRAWAMRMHNRHGWSLGGGEKAGSDPISELFGEEPTGKLQEAPVLRLEIDVVDRKRLDEP